MEILTETAYFARPRALQWGHDFSAVEIDSAYSTGVFCDVLQWGHDFSAVEIVSVRGFPVWPFMLQWGHDFSAVEIPFLLV